MSQSEQRETNMLRHVPAGRPSPCTQCGQPFSAPACGPTHAVVYAAQTMAANDERIREASKLSVDIWQEVATERARAHVKHGDKSSESCGWQEPRRLSILIEEIGEVTKEFNDADLEGRPVDALAVRAELIQVAAMAGAWADAVPVPGVYPDPWKGGAHSRACGIGDHEHGPSCSDDCPTCTAKRQPRMCHCGCGGPLTVVGHVDKLTGQPATIYTPPECLTQQVRPQAEPGPIADPEIDSDCPHASPHRYCDGCKVSPCPVGLGGEA